MNELIDEINQCFSGEDADEYKFHISRYTRDAIAVVYRYIVSFPPDETVRVYAVGGTGILFECLNGMVGFANAELTSIPYGNGNDFALTFGTDAIEKFKNIKELVKAPSYPMDIIHCGSNYMLIGMSIGLIGQTVLQAGKTFPHLPAKWLRKNTGLAYSLCALWSLFNKKIMQQKYTILLDGEDVSGQYCNITVNNTATMGGGLTPTPYAKPDDGLLDILMINNSKIGAVMSSIGEHNKGHYEKYDYYHYKICKTMEITSEILLAVEMDGEAFHAKELKLSIIPGGIKVFAPEGLSYADYSSIAYKKSKKTTLGGSIKDE